MGTSEQLHCPHMMLVMTTFVITASCTGDPGPAPRFDYDAATSNVTVDVEGEGFSAGWKVTLAAPHDPTNPIDIFIYIGRDDCPTDLGMNNAYISIHGINYPGAENLDIIGFNYYTIDECVVGTCLECPYYSVEEAIVSGSVECDWNSQRLRMVFGDFMIDVLDPPPEPGTPVIHSITLDGEFLAPAM